MEIKLRQNDIKIINKFKTYKTIAIFVTVSVPEFLPKPVFVNLFGGPGTNSQPGGPGMTTLFVVPARQAT